MLSSPHSPAPSARWRWRRSAFRRPSSCRWSSPSGSSTARARREPRDGQPAATLARAFGAGWWLGFGYFVAGFWWLSAAFLIDPAFTWALPIGVLGLPAVLALFFGAGFVVARLLWVPGPARILALALGLALAEWARGHLFTGFPWNPLGMGLGGNLVTAQLAALVGLDGLNLVTVALFAAPATLADRRTAPRWRPSWSRLPSLGARLWLRRGWRLTLARPADVPNVVRPHHAAGPAARCGVLEPRTATGSSTITSHCRSRTTPPRAIKLDDVTMLVWPESPFPFILQRDPFELGKIGAMLPQNTSLVTGAAREVAVPAQDGHAGYSDYYNSILVIARGGRVVGSYDKVHLVPFGEYLPFDAALRAIGLRNFVDVPGGFQFGDRRRALIVPGMPTAAPLICYEAIFPGEVRPASGQRPQYLLNITNDGWFGVTSGPSQHMAQARLRAIEEGLPMVRGAATGVSAMIDPYGRVLEHLPLGPEGIIDARLPQPIAPPLFAWFGVSAFWVVWLYYLLDLFAISIVYR